MTRPRQLNLHDRYMSTLEHDYIIHRKSFGAIRCIGSGSFSGNEPWARTCGITQPDEG